MIVRFETVAWELSLRSFLLHHCSQTPVVNFSLIASTLELSLGFENLRVGSFAWDRSLENFRSGTLPEASQLTSFDWWRSLENVLLGSFRVEDVAWKLSLGNVNLGIVAWDRWLHHLRL